MLNIYPISELSVFLLRSKIPFTVDVAGKTATQNVVFIRDTSPRVIKKLDASSYSYQIQYDGIFILCTPN